MGDAYSYRGLAYAKKGMYERALDDTSKAVETSGIRPDYYLARGQIYLLQGEREKAESDFTELLRIDAAPWHYQQAQDLLDKLK